MMHRPWRALLGKSALLLIVTLALGCKATPPTVGSPVTEVSPTVEPPLVEPAAKPIAAAQANLRVTDHGPTPLEQLARANEELKAQREHRARLEQRLLDEKAHAAELEAKLAEKDQTIDRLQRQLADMAQAIEEVRAEVAAAEALRPQILVLQAQRDAAREEVDARKNELLQLTLKLEDIYHVLIEEFERRAARDVAAQPE